jgi:DNA end-binding protein Ku
VASERPVSARQMLPRWGRRLGPDDPNDESKRIEVPYRAASIRSLKFLDLTKHIVNQKAADFEPEKFEDHYEEALTELINAKRCGKTIAAKPRPRGENVVDLMDALKKSIASEVPAKGKKSRKASAGQKEMLMSIQGKKTAKETAVKKSSAKQRKSA